MTMAGAALTAAFLVQVGPAQTAAPKQTAKAPAKAPAAKGKSAAIPAGDWPMYSRDLTSSRYSSAQADHHRERGQTGKGVELSPRRARRRLRPPRTTPRVEAQRAEAGAEAEEARPPSWRSRHPSSSTG